MLIGCEDIAEDFSIRDLAVGRQFVAMYTVVTQALPSMVSLIGSTL